MLVVLLSSLFFPVIFFSPLLSGDATDIKYQTLVNCDLLMVEDEFSKKPYAVAVQQGSPLKDQLNDA